MVSLSCPGARGGPGFGVRFHRVGTAVEEEFHQIGESPAAGPAERSAHEQIVADVEASAGIEYRRCEADGVAGPVAALACSVAGVHPDDVMQDGSAEVEARIRIAVLQHKLEAFERAKN